MTIPLPSYEVRWFFDGAVAQHAALQRWFDTAAPIAKRGTATPPSLKDAVARIDRYLLLPGGEEIGIKWREGEFQIKGRVAHAGIQVFGGRHQGAVERWVKWSYSKMPPPYQRLFDDDKARGLVIVPVVKRRVLRKVALDPLTGAVQEVGGKDFIDRGLGLELTDLEVGGTAYCSLGFEAFPDDSGMAAAFTKAVDAFLAPLTEPGLTAAQSESYPAFLARITA